MFAVHEDDFGQTSVVQHQIPTGDAPPIQERHRPVPPNMYAELRGLLQGMLESGVVKESSSPLWLPLWFWSERRMGLGASVLITGS